MKEFRGKKFSAGSHDLELQETYRRNRSADDDETKDVSNGIAAKHGMFVF